MRVWIAVAVGVVVIALGGTTAWLLRGGDEVASVPPGSADRRLPANGVLVFARGRWGVQDRNTWRVFSADGESTPTQYVPGAFDDPWVAPSPDGSRVAYTRRSRPADADLWILNRSTNRAQRVTSGRGTEVPWRWSPDGGHLLFNVITGRETSEMHVVGFDGTEETRLELVNRSPITRADWTGDAQLVGATEFLGDPGSLYAVDLGTSETTQLVATLHRRFFTPGPDGEEVIEVDGAPGPPETQQVWIAKAEGHGDPRLLATIPRGELNEAEWSPDGRRVALVARFFNGPMRLAILRTDARTTELRPESGVDGSSPVWAPDGTKLAYVAGPLTSADLWTVDANAEHPRRLTHTRTAEYPIAWLAAPETH
jgi:Tol biopolymer transport system component